MKDSKNSGIPAGRLRALFGCALLLVLSLFLFRAALSISTILFVGIALLHRDFFRQVRAFVATPYLLALSLLFLIPFVSGGWSTDVGRWADVVRLKLPLLFFPLAFAGGLAFSPRQEPLLCRLLLGLVTAGCLWGLVNYVQNAPAIHESYLRAKTIPTPLEDDHVRFSWLVSVAAILSLWLADEAATREAKAGWWLLAAFFAFYLHVLSARTGLFSLYLFLLIYAVWQVRRLRNRKVSVALLAGLVALPFLAYTLLPTFRARLRYNLYDLSFVQKSEYLPGSSDGARALSLKAGWSILRQHPLGAGAGDVMHEADKWYAANVPQALASDKLAPSSEWLQYGAFAGWPGLVLFTAVMAFPFFLRRRHGRIYWVGFHATAAFSFLFDMGLEVQFGIFLYAFIACWWWVRSGRFDERSEGQNASLQ